MNKRARKPRNAELYRAILTLNTPEELMRFFDDLCTRTELVAMEQRYQVAELLSDENMNYNKITECTGASSATISRVNNCLQNDDGNGYALAMERRRARQAAGEE